jgi:hypothetical protein
MKSNAIQDAIGLAGPYGQQITAVDTDCLFVVQYVPANGTGATAATLSVNTMTLRFRVGGTTPAGVDVIGNTTGQILLTTYDSLGELIDYINGRQAWRAYLVGGMRSDASKRNVLAAAAASCYGANGLAVLNDTSTSKFTSIAISGCKFVSNARNGWYKDKDSACQNVFNWGCAEINFTSGTCYLDIYTAGQEAGNDGVRIYRAALTSTTVKELTTGVVDGVYASSVVGERLVIRCTCSSTLNSMPTMGFQVTGRTRVLKGDHIITDKNFT